MLGQFQIFLRPPVILGLIERLAQIAVVERDLRLQQRRFPHFCHRRVSLIPPKQHQAQAQMRQTQGGILSDGGLKHLAGLIHSVVRQLQEAPHRVDHRVIWGHLPRPFGDLHRFLQPAHAKQQGAFLNQRLRIVRIEGDRLLGRMQRPIQIKFGLLDPTQTQVCG